MQLKPTDRFEGGKRSERSLAVHSGADGEPAVRRRRRERRTDWRVADGAASRMDTPVGGLALALAAVAVGASLVVNHAFDDAASLASITVLWAGLGGVAAFVLWKAYPAGVFRFRTKDVIWGTGLAIALRMSQALIQDPNQMPFPTNGLTGVASEAWLAIEVVPFLLLGPTIEELFFRAFLLTFIFRFCRVALGVLPAAISAVLGSTGLFVCLHAVFTPLSFTEAAQFFYLGSACGILVLVTGRLSGALILHIIYNATYLALATIGTQLQ